VLKVVRVYTDKSLIDEEIIVDNNNYFNVFVGVVNVCPAGVEALAAVDGVTEIYTDVNRVLTPFGVAQASELSTGVKTVLNVLYLKNRGVPFAVDLTSCGPNALREIFKVMDGDTNGKLLLTQPTLPLDVKQGFILNDVVEAEDGVMLGMELWITGGRWCWS
jgi:hypothetical protein